MSMKILTLDIETKPHQVYCWGLWKQNVSINQIVEAGGTICYAAKWAGSKKVMFDSVHESSERDMLQGIWDLLDSADAVLTYNGKSFDLPTLYKEFLLHEMGSPSPFKDIDLLNTTRKKFRFASRKLDYVCQQLGIGAKTKHMGMQLWTDCMAGDDKAWRLMKRYNKQDVILLEDLYKKLLPWIDLHPHHGLYLDDDAPVCRNCGSKDIWKEGFAYTQVGKYQQYSCKSCGRWGRGKKMLESVEVR